MIARDGEILLADGYGPANREWDNLNTLDTNFRIGWLTMQFTAMSILILQERGLLTVEDLVCQYFEECPAAWEPITIHHLLTHTSGIPDFSRQPSFQKTMALRTTPMDTIESFMNEPLRYVPGDAGDNWSLSLSDYIVLGYIIEQVSGDKYQTFLRDNIFKPLEMTSTDYDDNTRILKHRAEGYANAYRKADYVHISNLFSAAGLCSTVEDLYVWTQALFGGEVVSQESWDAMVAAAVSLNNPSAGILYVAFPSDWISSMYGLFLWSRDGHIAIDHGSMIDGFSGVIRYYPDDDLTIIILNNINRTGDDMAWYAADTFADMLFAE